MTPTRSEAAAILGSKGGKRRAKLLSSDRLSEIAKLGGLAKAKAARQAKAK